MYFSLIFHNGENAYITCMNTIAILSFFFLFQNQTMEMKCNFQLEYAFYFYFFIINPNILKIISQLKLEELLELVIISRSNGIGPKRSLINRLNQWIKFDF